MARRGNRFLRPDVVAAGTTTDGQRAPLAKPGPSGHNARIIFPRESIT
jgi:hypothetical protein